VEVLQAHFHLLVIQQLQILVAVAVVHQEEIMLGVMAAQA
jgi:hypothetical protein